MQSREALRVLAELSELQWGLVTSAQASARGVNYMNLTRLAESGDLIRLSHGIYRDGGAPGDEYLDLRAAWLAADPARPAWERLSDHQRTVVVSGESAASLHGIGNFRAARHEFTTPTRRQTQRTDVHYRTRNLTRDDVTVRSGLPVTTLERTIADLVEQRAQLDHVGDALRDAARLSHLDVERLTGLLAPLAERNGHRAGDGAALLQELLGVARIDIDGLSQQIAGMPELGAAVVREFMATMEDPALLGISAIEMILEDQARQHATLIESLTRITAPSLSAIDEIAKSMAAVSETVDVASIRSMLDSQARQLATVSQQLSALATPHVIALEGLQTVIQSLANAGNPLNTDLAHLHLSDAISAVEWAPLAQQAKRIEGRNEEQTP